jgi:hypothetical protein
MLKEKQTTPVINTDIKNYRPVEGPTTRQLEWGLWWVEHRALLRRIVLGILIALNVGLWGFSLFYLGAYAATGIIADGELARASVKQQPINHAAIVQAGARDLNVGTVQVFSNTGGAYDLNSPVTNPNTNWYAHFDYAFSVGSDTTSLQHGFILPQESKYLTYFLYKGNRPSAAGVQISNIRWQRLDPREVGDITEYLKQHTDLAITDVAFSAESAGSVPLNRVSFTIQNNSPYNYWDTEIYLLLQSGSRLVGINKYMVEKLRSGDVQNIDTLWTGNLSGGSITVKLSVDIFDQDNYMPFDLGTGQVK